MGVDTDGGMIVGEEMSKITLPDEADIRDWMYDNNLSHMSPWYDSGPENWTIGFSVNNVPVDKMDVKWLEDIKLKAEKFEKLTGTKARLIGMQNVY